MVAVPLISDAPRVALHVVGPGLTASDGALDLVPVPLLLARLDGERVAHEAHNRSFAAAALGEPALDVAIATFLRSDAVRSAHDWLAGGPIERRHYRMSFSRLTHRAAPTCLVSFVDQTAEVRTEDTLRREMATDSLTGLPNRRGFTDAVEAGIAGVGGLEAGRWAVLMIDLERFSRINACLGSMAGDELLITVARRIKGALRGRDVLARTGGDEFAVLLTIDAQADEADQVARRIRQALSTPFRLSDYEICVTCAIGIAFGDGGSDAEDVIRHAQLAMKRSKVTKDAESYHARALDSARAEFAMETALRRAIENRALELVYQPICDLETGRVASFEALVRWTDEAGVAHEPTQFIAVAEESGLIVPLGRWAIDEALRTLAAWDARAVGGCGVSVAVNVSAIQFQRDALPLIVERALAQHGLAGARLKLELTESAIVGDPERVTQLLMALKALGTTIAMDDFGTGFSNLASLQKLPIDVLKIDRSFVTEMLHDRDKVAMVRAILGLAQALGMATVAEGIETVEVAQTLAALGCTYGQGYAYARPLAADEAYQFLAARNA